ncbi:MAG: glycosyltransferase [Anaerolineaceae bacterium]|jgi:hypothetical protein
MKNGRKPAVVFWGPHSNSSEQFARRLNAPLYLIHYFGWKKLWNAPFKYPLMWVKTWWLMSKQKPSAILVINTPVFAPLCVYLYCRLAGIPYAMNVHGHTLGGRRWGWSVPLQRFLARRAAVNLVGTTEYQNILNSWHAKTLFLEEPPIIIPAATGDLTDRPVDFEVTVVSTFAGDEPLEPVLEAARMTPDVHYSILGDVRLAKRELLDSAPVNVTFTGYLKGNAYWDQLRSSQAVMVLTTNPYSLVAGGSEGLYCGIPLILSRQPALVDYFTRGAVFVEHTPESLAEGVATARANQKQLKAGCAELATERTRIWEHSFVQFEALMGISSDSVS